MSVAESSVFRASDSFQKGTFLNAAVRAVFKRHTPQTSVEGLEKYDLMKILSKRFLFEWIAKKTIQNRSILPNHLSSPIDICLGFFKPCA